MLPQDFELAPPAHAPFIVASLDSSVFETSPPSLAVEFPPRTLNTYVRSRMTPLPDPGGAYTVEVTLRVEMPDSPFRVAAITYGPDGRGFQEIKLLDLPGRNMAAPRRFRASFRLDPATGADRCAIVFGLPYAKCWRSGRLWIDDLELREGPDSGDLALYVTPQSVAAGDVVQVHPSCGNGSAVVTVFREGAERVPVLGPFPVAGLRAEATPADADSAGCRWPARFEIPVDATWPSGLYAVEMDDGDKVEHATFVVRGRGNEGPALVILPTNTQQAYNAWAGRSMYTANPTPVASFARPYASTYLDAYTGPIHLLRWLSREGIGFGVMTDADLGSFPDLVHAYPAILFAGHNEYWTRGMRRTVEAHLGRGGSVISLSGNTCWWQARIEGEDEEQRLVCWKYGAWRDPIRDVDPSLTTTHWDEPPLNDPPSRLLGLTWRTGGMVNWSTSSACPCDYDWLNGYGGYRVHHADSWVFAGTGLVEGDSLGQRDAIVGHEVDGAIVEWREDAPYPTGAGGTDPDFAILGSTPCFNEYNPDRRGLGCFGVWELGPGIVFNGGTVGWCWGLERDPAVQAITRNVLLRAIAGGAPGPALHLVLDAAPNPGRNQVHLSALAGPHRADIYDVSGRRVAGVMLSAITPGRSASNWDFRDAAGRRLPAGSYWARIGSGPAVHIVRVP